MVPSLSGSMAMSANAAQHRGESHANPHKTGAAADLAAADSNVRNFSHNDPIENSG